LSPSIGAFIGGFFVGIILGGVASFVVTMGVVGVVGVVGTHLARFSVNPVYAFVVVYALGFLFGILAIRLIRVRLDFVSGLATGGAASFLGVTALCNTLLGGLGSMH
jgi:hypothetical protein